MWLCSGSEDGNSIPNDLFDGWERLARRTRGSRSRLFTDALREYLARHAPDKVTESMYEAMMEIGKAKDEVVSSKARGKQERTEWRYLRNEIWWEDLSASACSDPGFFDPSCLQYRTKGHFTWR